MQIKEIISLVVIVYLGVLVSTEIFYLLLTGSLLSYLFVVKPAVLDINPLVFGLPALAVLIIGIYVGFTAYRKKNLFFNIFFPKKNTLIITLISAILYATAMVAVFGTAAFVAGPTFQFQTISSVYLVLLVGIISNFLTFYPFVALLHFAYKNKRLKAFKKRKPAILCAIVLLNPIFIIFSASFSSLIIFSSMNEPCGVGYSDFTPDSPAQNAGMSLNEKIIEIDGTPTKSVVDLYNYLNATQYQKNVIVKTDKSTYSLQLRFDPSYNKYMIGILNSRTEFCAKSLY